MSAALSRLATLTELRARLGAPRVRSDRRPSGVLGLDAWLGGWPESGLVEIVGLPGSGRLGLVAPLLGALTRQGRPVAVVDPGGLFYPPGLDVDLGHLLLVRPPSARAVWAAEQVARSGALDAALLLQLPRPGRGGAVRLGRAVEAGRSLVFVVAEASDPELPAALRLEVRAAGRVRCNRSRWGHEGEERGVLGA